MSLITLIYVSQTTQEMQKKELLKILETSRGRNRMMGITGMLLFRDGIFVQVLEGSKQAVHSLYEKIKSDPRHTSVVKVYEASIAHRSHGEWSMAFNFIEDEVLRDMGLQEAGIAAIFKAPSHTHALIEEYHDQSYF